MDLSLTGLASGFDWESLVDQLVEVERTPQTRLASEQNAIRERDTAYGSLKTQLGVLQNRVKALQDTSLFGSRLASVSDATVATATASGNTSTGKYVLNVVTLATNSLRLGTAGVTKSIHASNDVSNLAISSAKLATPITTGSFTVNGQRVTVEAGDTLQMVFDRISAATAASGAVTGSYDSTSDKVTLQSSGEIVLGSAGDTSNFLQALKLSNNGSGVVTSAFKLGSLSVGDYLSSANFDTTINDGGSGAGLFKINGIEIQFNADTDSVNTVLQRINQSAAGVTARYDTVNHRFSLTNKSTGNLDFTFEDVSGNFLAATGLSTGSTTRGKDLVYTINQGNQITSHSNTITEISSGIAGLTINALKEGATTITVAQDSDKIKSAISGFIEEYNRVQTLIDQQTASTTDATGKVTAGALAGESDANDLANRLRKLVYTTVGGLSGTIDQMAKIGYQSNGYDNTLKLDDSDLLDSALTDNLDGIKAFFQDSETGLATQFGTYLEGVIGEKGTLTARQDAFAKQIQSIDTQIADQERMVQAHRAALVASFVAMETAQSKINQQLQFLEKNFGS